MTPGKVNQMFFDLIDHLILRLSETDKLYFDLSHKLQTLKASDSDILFTDQFLQLIANSKSLYLFKSYLLPFITWFDHSILNELLEASGNCYAIKLLDQFDSMIDETQPVTSFPIPTPGQLIIPLHNSKYTLIATKFDNNEEVMSLKQVKVIKKLMEHTWKVTSHALQLVAMCTKSGFLYWMIPECIAVLIKSSLNERRYELWECGFISIVLLPQTFYFQDGDYDEKPVGAFDFLSQYDEVHMYTYMHIHTCICCYMFA